MLRTEGEAKLCWCPFSRVMRMVDPNAGSIGPFNRAEFETTKEPCLPIASYCIASACMAWRWHDIEASNHPAQSFRVPDDENVRGQKTPHSVGHKLMPRRGYCGLAGKDS